MIKALRQTARDEGCFPRDGWRWTRVDSSWHVGQWRYSSTYMNLSTRFKREASCKIRPFYPEEGAPVPIS